MERERDQERNNREQLERKLQKITDENQDLQKQIDALQDELVETKHPGGGSSVSAGGSSSNDETEFDERRLRELEENVRMKNKQIHQLLDDIQQVEQDSLMYQNKVVELRDKLHEATKQINAMSGDYVAMKETFGHQQELMETVQGENLRLRTLMEEYLEEKKVKDKKFKEEVIRNIVKL